MFQSPSSSRLFYGNEFFSHGALLNSPIFLIRGGASMPLRKNFSRCGFFYSSRSSPVSVLPVSRSSPAPGSASPLVTPARGLGASHAF